MYIKTEKQTAITPMVCTANKAHEAPLVKNLTWQLRVFETVTFHQKLQSSAFFSVNKSINQYKKCSRRGLQHCTNNNRST